MERKGWVIGRACIIIVLGVITAACGSALAFLATVTSSYADPVGDNDPTILGTQYDVTKMVTRRMDTSPAGSYDTLQVELTFVQAVVLPAPGTNPGAAELALFVGFDVDQDAATQAFSLDCIPIGGSGGAGTWGGLEFLVGMHAPPFQRLPNGNLPVVAGGGVIVGEATVAAAGSVLTINIPLSALGGDDGATHAVATIGNGSGGFSASDCAPNPTGSVITRQGAPAPHPVRTR